MNMPNQELFEKMQELVTEGERENTLLVAAALNKILLDDPQKATALKNDTDISITLCLINDAGSLPWFYSNALRDISDAYLNSEYKDKEDTRNFLNEYIAKEVLKLIYEKVGKNEFDIPSIAQVLHDNISEKMEQSIRLALSSLEKNTVLDYTLSADTLVYIMKLYNDVAYGPRERFTAFIDRLLGTDITEQA